MAGKGTLLQPRMITHTRMHQYQQRGRLLFVCWSGKRHKGAQPSTDAQAQAQAQARAERRGNGMCSSCSRRSGSKRTLPG